jgi:ParB family chromosome partitioning protein
MNTPAKRPQFAGLGRGLSALLGENTERDANFNPVAPATASAPVGERLPPRILPIAQLKPNPFQPRHTFDSESLEDLANSIREKGILQPILVRPVPGVENEYQIVAGERRWRAAQKARLHEVPVVIKSLTDSEALEFALIENIQRADLNAMEEARGYKQLIDKFHYTQEALGQVIGKSRSHIANTMRLMQLPQVVQDFITSGQLSAGHARTLVGVDDPEKLAREMIAGRMNVREAEDRGRQAKGKKKRSHGKDADTRALEASLSSQLGLAVTINGKGEKGEIKIAYKTLEQLDEVCRRLGQPN